ARRQVLVGSKYGGWAVEQVLGEPLRRRTAEHGDADVALATGANVDRARGASIGEQRHLEGGHVLVDPHRRQLDEPMRQQRAPQVDRLAPGPAELELC